jgi:hypothetical protein
MTLAQKLCCLIQNSSTLGVDVSTCLQVDVRLKPILLRLCARYVLQERRRGLALDPVANFHLRNGGCFPDTLNHKRVIVWGLCHPLFLTMERDVDLEVAATFALTVSSTGGGHQHLGGTM